MSSSTKSRPILYKPLHETIQSLIKNFDAIAEERRVVLKQLSDFDEAKARRNESVELIFI